MWHLDIMQNNLNPSDLRRLKAIFEPTVVCVPPDDARRGMCVMPDGEIRSYGLADKVSVWGSSARSIYLSSRNCGLDWVRIDEADGTAPIINYGKALDGALHMGSASRIPWDGGYVSLFGIDGGAHTGTWAMLSKTGPGDENPRLVKICDTVYIDMFLPTMLESRRRIITTASLPCSDTFRPAVIYSDDDGESWTIVPLAPTPKHKIEYPHCGTRWQNNGAEPNLCELPDGRLMLLMRTSLDFFWVYYSSDGGGSWTHGEQSIFHGTLTTPFLIKLHDGRVVVLWNNTSPLPEPNHENTFPPVSENVKRGLGEDVFTNRDVNHAAITSDGVNWSGFRELYLNDIRNAADFRVKGGALSSADKSVHQFQAIELPYNKLLVSFGQHEISRRTVIFDIDWLYSRERTEDFQMGLKNISTHMYVKSISDCNISKGFGGHCAWNRTDGALLVPDPDATYGEALQICRVKDERLVSEIQGAVWNFPMAYSGELKLQIRISGAGIRVTLCDHWYNPTDVFAREFSPFSFSLTGDILPLDSWQEVSVRFDTEAGSAEVCRDGENLFSVRMKRMDVPTGLSYLHMQTLAEGYDVRGTYIRRIEMRANPA